MSRGKKLAPTPIVGKPEVPAGLLNRFPSFENIRKAKSYVAQTPSTFLSVAVSALLASVFLGQQTFSVYGKAPGLLDRFWPTSTKLASSTPGLPDSYVCTHDYTIEILSFDPLIMYINNFLKEEEVDYLLELRKDDFMPSLVYNEGLESIKDERFRTSRSAMVPAKDPVSSCLSQRMKAFLGNLQHIDTEPLQLVLYEESQRFRLHYDWFDQPNNKTYIPDYPHRPYNRLGTIFAVLDGNCTGGETFFPNVKGVAADADGDKYTRTDEDMGLLVKPRRGNAVFWNNLFPNRTGDPRVLHAGLPVNSGRKIGMNLFSYGYLDSPLIGGED